MSVATSPRLDSKVELAQIASLPTGDSVPTGPYRVNPWLAAGLAAFALVAGIAIVQQLDSARFDRYSGQLAARISILSVPFDAEVESILAPVGAVVKKGDPLVRLKNTTLARQLDQVRHEICSLEKERTQAEARCAVEIEWRKRDIEAEIFTTKIQQAGFLQQKLNQDVEEIAWKSVEPDDQPNATESKPALIDQVGFRPIGRKAQRMDALIRSEAARNAGEVASAQVELCEQRLTELNTALAGISDKVRASSGIEVIEQRLADAKETFSGLETKQQALTLAADATGIVGVYRVTAGGFVSAHNTIVQVIDEDRPHLQVEVPTDRIVEFRPGETVALLFPGNVERTGRVESIPPQTRDASNGERPAVVMSVAPTGKLWPKLPLGSGAEVLKSRFSLQETDGHSDR